VAGPRASKIQYSALSCQCALGKKSGKTPCDLAKRIPEGVRFD
jgi:hypothetical protein